MRSLCLDAMALAGPGSGRQAIDLGCGAGKETLATAERRLARARRRLPAGHQGPAAGDRPGGRGRPAQHRGAGLPGTPRPSAGGPHLRRLFAAVHPPGSRSATFWAVMLGALGRGGVVAVNLFGDRDSWADVPEWNFHTEAAARQLFDGLEILKFEVYDDDGQSFRGPKHWHIYDVVARSTVTRTGRRHGKQLLRAPRHDFRGTPRVPRCRRAKSLPCVTRPPAAEMSSGSILAGTRGTDCCREQLSPDGPRRRRTQPGHGAEPAELLDDRRRPGGAARGFRARRRHRHLGDHLLLPHLRGGPAADGPAGGPVRPAAAVHARHGPGGRDLRAGPVRRRTSRCSAWPAPSWPWARRPRTRAPSSWSGRWRSRRT